MKKQILALLLSTLCATSSVLAMEISENEAEKKPVGKRFAVVTEAQLDCSLLLNYHVEITEKQPSFLNLKKISLEDKDKTIEPDVFSFEIKNYVEENGILAFPVKWNNVQYYDPYLQQANIFPWQYLDTHSDRRRYRVVHVYEGVIGVNIAGKPYASEGENVYYSANVYKALSRFQHLWYHDESSSIVSWDLSKGIQKFSYKACIAEEHAECEKESKDPEMRQERELEDQRLWEEDWRARKRELNLLTQEAVSMLNTAYLNKMEEFISRPDIIQANHYYYYGNILPLANERAKFLLNNQGYNWEKLSDATKEWAIEKFLSQIPTTL